MGFDPQKTVLIFPGPTIENPPFDQMRVNESDVASYLAKGWSTEAPEAEEDDDPETAEEKPKGKKKK